MTLNGFGLSGCIVWTVFKVITMLTYLVVFNFCSLIIMMTNNTEISGTQLTGKTVTKASAAISYCYFLKRNSFGCLVMSRCSHDVSLLGHKYQTTGGQTKHMTA